MGIEGPILNCGSCLCEGGVGAGTTCAHVFTAMVIPSRVCAHLHGHAHGHGHAHICTAMPRVASQPDEASVRRHRDQAPRNLDRLDSTKVRCGCRIAQDGQITPARPGVTQMRCGWRHIPYIYLFQYLFGAFSQHLVFVSFWPSINTSSLSFVLSRLRGGAAIKHQSNSLIRHPLCHLPCA